MENRKTKILNPITGKYFSWKIEPEPVFSGYYNLGVDRLHKIVRDLLLKKSYRSGSIMASSSPNTLAKLFKLYDTDGSGSLDMKEFYQMLADLGIQGITQKDYHDLFKRYDIDGDGTISYNEWANAHCSHFSSDAGLLDLPSTRLDIRHVTMSPTEAIAEIIKDINKVLYKTGFTMHQLVGWGYFGTKNPENLTIREVKRTLRGQFNVGIGNEAALDLLLAKCTVSQKNLSVSTLQKYLNPTGVTGLTDRPTTSNVSNRKKNIALLTPRRPTTTRPGRCRIRPLEM